MGLEGDYNLALLALHASLDLVSCAVRGSPGAESKKASTTGLK